MISYKEYNRSLKISQLNNTPMPEKYMCIKDIIDNFTNDLTEFEILGEEGFVYYKNKTNIIFKVDLINNIIYGNVNDLWLSLFFKTEINRVEATKLLEEAIYNTLPYKNFALKTSELDDKASTFCVHKNEKKFN